MGKWPFSAPFLALRSTSFEEMLMLSRKVLRTGWSHKSGIKQRVSCMVWTPVLIFTADEIGWCALNLRNRRS